MLILWLGNLRNFQIAHRECIVVLTLSVGRYCYIRAQGISQDLQVRSGIVGATLSVFYKVSWASARQKQLNINRYANLQRLA